MPTVTPERVTQVVGLLLTMSILWILHEQHHHRHEHEGARHHDVAVSLMSMPPEPEQPKPEPPEPKPVKPHELRVMQRIVQAAPEPSPTTVSDTPAASLAAVAVAASPPPAPAAPSQASIENAYAAALRENVDARTSVPDSAEYRLVKPSGATQVRFVLDRGGNPSDVDVAHSSGSRILDRQAVGIVASGHYPPFPESAFAGESRHVFTVTIEFRS